MKCLRLPTLVFWLSGFLFAQNITDNRNHTFKSFSSVKKAVYEITEDHKTFYCNCTYDSKKQIDLESCGYKPRKNIKRAARVEIEHVVPAEKLCGNTREWKQGNPACIDSRGKPYKGRRCASEHNEVCKMAYNDLHNLRPAIGELNNDRSNYPFREIPGKKSVYGKCTFIIENNMADPPDNVQGDIARIYLHMNDAYPELKILNPEETSMYNKWSGEDAVTIQECAKNKKIHALQGNYNLVILRECKKLDSP